MPFKSLWSRLRRPEAHAGRPRLRMQTLGLSEAQARTLRPVLDRIDECLDVLLELDARQGDIVLAEQHFVRRTTPQQLASLCEARPLVTCDLLDSPDPALSALALLESRQRVLLRQLRDLPMVRGLSPQFGASGWGPDVVQASQLGSGFDEDLLSLDAPALDAAQQRFVDTLLDGLTDPTQAPMVATYGPRAALRADFPTHTPCSTPWPCNACGCTANCRGLCGWTRPAPTPSRANWTNWSGMWASPAAGFCCASSRATGGTPHWPPRRTRACNATAACRATWN